MFIFHSPDRNAPKVMPRREAQTLDIQALSEILALPLAPVLAWTGTSVATLALGFMVRISFGFVYIDTNSMLLLICNSKAFGTVEVYSTCDVNVSLDS